MNFDHDPKDPEPRSFPWRGTRVAALIGGLALTLIFGTTCPPKAGAQDLLSELALIGVSVVSGTMAPRCVIERAPPPAIARPSPPPARNANVQVYPPPPRPRSVNVGVWPEPPAARRSVAVRVSPAPVRRPVGTWSNGGYVLGGSIPAQQPATSVASNYDPGADLSYTQERLRRH